MAIPKVKMQIVLGGVKEVQKSIKTLQKSLSNLEKNQINSQKKTNKIVDSDFKQSISRRTGLIKNYERTYINSLNRIRSAEVRLNRQSTSSSGGIGRVRSSRIGAGSAGGGSMASIAKFGPIAAVAATGLWAFSKAVSYVTSAIQKNAAELVSGVTQIGGGFSISDAMISSAQTQKLSANIAAQSSGATTTAKVHSWASSMGSTTEHKSLEWAKGLKSYQTMTGDLSGFQDNATFMGDVASVTGIELEDLGKAVGLLKKQFGDVDLKELVLRIWQSGKEGVIELTNVDKMTEITGFATLFKGKLEDNVMDIVGGLQIVAPGSGGEASKAVTTLKGAITEILRNPAALQKEVGYGTMSKGKDGKYQFDSLTKAYASFAYLAKEAPEKLAKVIPNEEARKAVVAFGAAAPEKTEGESRDAYLSRLDSFFKDLLSTEASLSEFNEAVGIAKDTVDSKLKTMFNAYREDVGSQLLDVLDANSDKIKTMFDKLIESIPALVVQFQLMLDSAPMLAQAFESTIPAILEFAIIMSKISGQLSAIWNASRVMNEEEVKNLEKMRDSFMAKIKERKDKERDERVSAHITSANDRVETLTDPNKNYVLQNTANVWKKPGDMFNMEEDSRMQLNADAAIAALDKTADNMAAKLKNTINNNTIKIEAPEGTVIPSSRNGDGNLKK